MINRPEADPALYANGWSDMTSAPRNGTWIELGFVSGDYATMPRYARSSGNGDMPNIWRFANGSCLRFDDERLGLQNNKPSNWKWRAIDPALQDKIQADYDRERQSR